MTSGCLDRKEVRGAIWGVHSTTDRPAGGNTGRLFLAFGGPVCADRISNCPLDRVLTYKNLIYLLNLQFSTFLSSIYRLVFETAHLNYENDAKLIQSIGRGKRDKAKIFRMRSQIKRVSLDLCDILYQFLSSLFFL